MVLENVNWTATSCAMAAVKKEMRIQSEEWLVHAWSGRGAKRRTCDVVCWLDLDGCGCHYSISKVKFLSAMTAKILNAQWHDHLVEEKSYKNDRHNCPWNFTQNGQFSLQQIMTRLPLPKEFRFELPFGFIENASKLPPEKTFRAEFPLKQQMSTRAVTEKNKEILIEEHRKHTVVIKSYPKQSYTRGQRDTCWWEKRQVASPPLRLHDIQLLQVVCGWRHIHEFAVICTRNKSETI